jgi:hypothetical protein
MICVGFVPTKSYKIVGSLQEAPAASNRRLSGKTTPFLEGEILFGRPKAEQCVFASANNTVV